MTAGVPFDGWFLHHVYVPETSCFSMCSFMSLTHAMQEYTNKGFIIVSGMPDRHNSCNSSAYELQNPLFQPGPLLSEPLDPDRHR